jgi:DNA-binding NtrC family response regulator
MPVGGTPHVVIAVPGPAEAEAALERECFDYAFIDLKLGTDRGAGRDVLGEIVRNHPATICIMMTSNSADEALEECLKAGAAEYIIKPFEFRIVHDIMRKARIVHRLWKQNRALRLQAGKSAVEPIWLTSKSPKFQRVLDQARRLKGKQNIAVFISGESGVGKEVLARFLWTLEEDETRVFIPVHTGALPKDLVESELFGFKKGAFSGANENKIGKFEAADGGDIFLDEIATMPVEAQVKLLRVLQQKEVAPLGSGNIAPKKIDVRVISATNENLQELIEAKRFREDLFFRLKMATLEIPPLRERMEDLEDLVAHFLRRASMSHKRLNEDAWSLCREYRWPGNVRELENAITVAAELSEGTEIKADDIRAHLQSRVRETSEATLAGATAGAGPYGLSEKCIEGNFSALTESFEQGIIRLALDKSGNSVTESAKYLKIPRTTLASKLRAWGWSVR